MQNRNAIAAALCSTIVLLGIGPASAGPAGGFTQLLVGRRAGADAGHLNAAAFSEGAVSVGEINQIRTHVMRVPSHRAARVAERLSRRAEVEFVEEDIALAPATMPNDPQIGWHVSKIDAPGAWINGLGEGVVIAVLDSGVDASHPDLAGKLVPGYNFYDGNTNTSDVYGHGTKVAGVAAAITDNALGVVGIGRESAIMPVRVTNTSGAGYISMIAQGLTWAADYGTRVMNVSFTGVEGSSTIRSAANYVAEAGGIVVAAAGNCGCDQGTADAETILSVGSTSSDDGPSGFSTRGPFVDVAAPGESIPTTTNGGGYGAVSGTSFASPIVAGVAALLMAHDPSLDASAIESILESTSLDLGSPGWDSGFGWGRIDAALAMAASDSESPVDTIAPQVTITSPGEGTLVSGTMIVTANANDDNAVTSVEFFVDAVLRGTDSSAPWSFAWDTAAESEGTHDLAAVAWDAAGNAGASGVIRVESANAVDADESPVIEIVTPEVNQNVKRTVQIVVSAADDVQVQSVEVRIDGSLLGSVLCASTECSPSFSWNTRREADGFSEIRAGVTDSGGHIVNSAPVTVTIGNGGGSGGSGRRVSRGSRR